MGTPQAWKVENNQRCPKLCFMSFLTIRFNVYIVQSFVCGFALKFLPQTPKAKPA